MNRSRRCGIVFPLVSIVSVLALSAHAQEPRGPEGRPEAHGAHPGPGRPGPMAGRGPHDAHFAHGGFPARSFGGHAYHGRLAWEGGHWRHEFHNGRNGWWWDVGGVWYFYPQQMEGPPAYVSDVEAMDDDGVPVGPPGAEGYAPPPPGYVPPPAAYAPPPPPPPPDPAASAVGGAVVGGLLGGLLTGRPGGAIAGAVAGGATGAIVGAQAAQRPGYYLAQGNCYYRYPSGQYVPVDPRSCY
ncbi:hypothetical protein [Bradyrhizobium erythrophlei]|uniref:Glycine zipper n=1 Tax=Bradyrhizobium erythrophlei TaxID=1437360 RepID=A0A1M5S4Z1_9BRAD|nr:hypothetical protein [Bradyrhizobium erythrophlei]SHH33515.1 hypothetical protein SAMN05443248_4479 [Bradyrhizobium erythrophlei]